MAEAGAAAAEEREVAGGDPRLQLVALLLRDRPGSDGRIDAVCERLLERVAQLGRSRRVLRRVVDHRLALGFGRELRRGDCRSAARDREAAPAPAASLCFIFRTIGAPFVRVLRGGRGEEVSPAAEPVVQLCRRAARERQLDARRLAVAEDGEVDLLAGLLRVDGGAGSSLR